MCQPWPHVYLVNWIHGLGSFEPLDLCPISNRRRATCSLDSDEFLHRFIQRTMGNEMIEGISGYDTLVHS